MLSDLIKLIRAIYGEGFIPLHAANITTKDRIAVSLCKRVDCYGDEVLEFEQALAKYTGAKHVIATCSGTAALYAIIEHYNYRKRAHIPNYTFRATENGARENGLECFYTDIEQGNLGIDSFWNLQSNIINIPVWVFGMPYTHHEGEALVVEDAAEALGTFEDGHHAGTFGNAGILSFNGNKILTTGGGGAILTDDTPLALHIQNFITQDFNLRMPALNAALGLSQLERIEDTVSRKRAIAHEYHNFFEGSDIQCIKEPVGCRANYWLNTLIMRNEGQRDHWFSELKDAGIEARKGFELLDPNADTPVAKEMVGKILNLPSGLPG